MFKISGSKIGAHSTLFSPVPPDGVVQEEGDREPGDQNNSQPLPSLFFQLW